MVYLCTGVQSYYCNKNAIVQGWQLDGSSFFGNNNIMARPRKNERLLMKSSIRVMLTEDQKKLIEEAASLEQLDMTAWVRPILLKAAEDRVTNGKRRKRPD